MAIQSVDQLYAAFSAGQTDRADWNKITGAAAYTAGRWYETFSLNGYPSPVPLVHVCHVNAVPGNAVGGG